MGRKRHSAEEVINKLRHADVELGNAKQIAEVFAVSTAWARRIKQCQRETVRVRPLG